MKLNPILTLLAAVLLTFSCSNTKNLNDLGKNNASSSLQVIAHRGGAKLAPENTLAAFRQALSLGVDMIEIDVVLSKDSAIIVIHDDRIDRTTNGKGIVKEMMLEELKKYDAGSWFDDKFKGESIPTLEEVFATINGRAILLIEIKGGDEKYPGLERKIVQTIHKYQANHWVIVQSFNEKSVLRVKEMDSSIPTYYLLGGNFAAFYSNLKTSDASSLPYDGIAVRHSLIDSSQVASIKKVGYDLFVWTVNETEDMQRLMTLDLDGIITDSPDRLQELINKLSKK